MQLTKEYIDEYFKKLLEKRKVILSSIESNPIIGIDISKLDRERKLFLGGIRKMAIEIDGEILAIFNFLNGESQYYFSEDINNIITEIRAKNLQLFDIEGDSIVKSKEFDGILNDAKKAGII